MTHGSQEDGIERPQMLQTISRHHLSGFQESFATPIKFMPVELESKMLSCRFKHANAFRHDLFPNAVPGDNCNAEGFHLGCDSSFIERKQPQKNSDIIHRFQCVYISDEVLDFVFGPLGIVRASSEFCRRFVKSHRISGAALGKVSAPSE